MAEHETCIGETSEWFTPPEIFASLRLTFDLDPCSPGPGHWVPARNYGKPRLTLAALRKPRTEKEVRI
jgi:hypothetical protein